MVHNSYLDFVVITSAPGDDLAHFAVDTLFCVKIVWCECVSFQVTVISG